MAGRPVLLVEDQEAVRDLARTLLERPGLRALFTPGYADTTSLDFAALGPHACPAKPFTTDGLARKVREALDTLARRS